MSPSPRSPYAPISDYALLADGHSAALVSRRGSIDWCCLERIDAAPVFARMLDHGVGGHCSIAPTGPAIETTRRYEFGLVLVTTIADQHATVTVTDALTVAEDPTSPQHQLLRVIEGREGSMDLRVELQPRFDYASLKPAIRRDDALISAVGGNDGLVIAGDLDWTVDGHDLSTEVTVAEGDRLRLSVVWMPPADIDRQDPQQYEAKVLDERLRDTLRWWQRWTDDAVRADTPEPIRRSVVVLKGLVNRDTGAVAAAPTTSLPEVVGGSRNWDYRYSWIRDSQFTVRSLAEAGSVDEADRFRRFIERSAAGNAESLQIAYGLGGERRLLEQTLTHLDGYRGSRPVRIGNAAAHQLQLDVFGYILELAWRWHERGEQPSDDYWTFLVSVCDAAADKWSQPDRGIWEVRGRPEHFVHSKVMCWAALDRGIRLACDTGRDAQTEHWSKVRDEIRDAVEHAGYDDERGVFRRTFWGNDLDASLLLIPSFDFVAYDDPRMVRTTDAICDHLADGGLLRRYVTDDGLDGREGVFVACAFWLVECLVGQDRLDEAAEWFRRATEATNELGQFSEEFDTADNVLLGNFPQALTHLSHVAAAVALQKAGVAVA